MKNLNRLKLRKWTHQEKEALIRTVVDEVLALGGPEEIILFGSALTDDFDDYSDLDLVLIFKDEASAKQGQKMISRNRSPAMVPVDLLCVDRKSFEQKSAVGGVYFIAKEDGRVIYPATPS